MRLSKKIAIIAASGMAARMMYKKRVDYIVSKFYRR